MAGISADTLASVGPPSRGRQASIEHYVVRPAAAGATATSAPSEVQFDAAQPPPFARVKGLGVIKDFLCEVTHRVRPFWGTVTAFHGKHGYNVVYVDGDSEDLHWKDLHPLLVRAAAASAQERTVACALPGDSPTLKSVHKQQAVAQAPARQEQQPPAKRQSPQQTKQPESCEQQKRPPKEPKRRGSAKHSSLPAAKKAPAAAADASASKKRPLERPAERTGGVEPATAKKAKVQKAGKQPAAAQPTTSPHMLPTSGKQVTSKRVPAAGCSKSAAAASKKQQPAADAAGPSGATSTTQQPDGREPPPKRARQPKRHAIQVPQPELDREYVYAPGAEPWRTLEGFSWEIRDEEDLSAEAVRALRTLQRTFHRFFIQAETDERARTDAAIAQQKRDGTFGTAVRPANRPGVRRNKVAGHFPGWSVGGRAYSRSELHCMGFHRVPIAGIDYVPANKAGNGAPAFATSVMVSGWYQDNSDSGHEMWYTGEGGNDLLHGRNQVADQALKRGNAALAGNIALGIPVRVTRKQKDPHGHFGCCYTYDGLYDVVAYRHVRGKEGTFVYQFKLRRRPGQGPLLSERVQWGGIAAARAVVPKTRQGVVDLDVSRGREERPIAAIDDTWVGCGDDRQPQGDIPPCTSLEDVVDEEALPGKVVRGINAERFAQLQREGYKPSVEYITQYVFVGKAADKAGQLSAAVLPPSFRTEPHSYLRALNHGWPYNDHGQLYNPRPVVFECGPWCGCADGTACRFAVTQRPRRFRLELFKSSTGCGWGVRSLDTIPMFAFITAYVGQVYDAEEHDHLVRTVEEQDASYTFEMMPRPDTEWDGSAKACPDEARAEFVACGLRKRNVGAFINHSCAPNCFVQPVLDVHHDLRCPKICIFASDNIPPLTELTLDYGEASAAGFPGGCKCGAAECISLRRPEAMAAGSKQQTQHQPEAKPPQRGPEMQQQHMPQAQSLAAKPPPQAQVKGGTGGAAQAKPSCSVARAGGWQRG